MALNGLTDKSETWQHAIVKFLIFISLKRKGYKAAVEFNAGEGSIFDCVDWTNGIVYEPYSRLTTKQLSSKNERYLNYSGVRDIKYVKLDKFKLTMSIKEWIDIIEKEVIV